MVAKVGRFIWPVVPSMASKAQLDQARRLRAASGYLDLEMPVHALRALDGVAHPEATPFEFYLLRGQALRSAGRFEEAIVALSRARDEQPDDLDVLMGLAWCFKRTDQLPRAISTMEEAYRAHPKVSVVLYNIACYYSLAGEKAQALSWLGRALRMNKRLLNEIPEETDFDPLRNDPDFQYIASLELLDPDHT
jgi:tetratricopeptide (TPR) repeat protein